MDQLSLAEPLQAKDLIIRLQRCVADLVGLGLGKAAKDLSSLVHSLVLVKGVQVNLRCTKSSSSMACHYHTA